MSSYDHPNHVITREAFFLTVAGNAAKSARWSPYQKCVLKRVQAQVVTAGTSATTGNKLDIYHGTTSIGSITLGTSTASTIGTASLNETISGAGADQVYVQNGTDATGVSNVTYVFQVLPDAADA